MKEEQMEDGKKLAITVLRKLGLAVEPIAEGDSRTADLCAMDGTATYFIEVKDKGESVELATTRRQTLTCGEVHQQEDPLDANNTISGILRDARRQLDQTPGPADRFQLVWFHGDGVDADTKCEQAFATFYGQVPVCPKFPHHDQDMKMCLYFDCNVAFEMPTVHALVLSQPKSLQVCLNELSPRLGEFRTTHLYAELLKLSALYDPTALATAGHILTLRSDVPRSNEAEVIQALQKQTGISYMPIRLRRYSSAAAVSRRSGG